jgi:hypothetical protein
VGIRGQKTPGDDAKDSEFTAFSQSARADTQDMMELFDVELAGEAARSIVDRKPANRWLSAGEIRAEPSRPDTRWPAGQPDDEDEAVAGIPLVS